MDDEFAEGKTRFLEMVKSLDGEVTVVIPVTPSRGNFLIALSKGNARKFISVTEDDIVDLPEDLSILDKVTADVQSAIKELSAA